MTDLPISDLRVFNPGLRNLALRCLQLMNTEHPITPPPELVTQWWHDTDQDFEAVAIRAAHWGGDQELEACCEWLNDNFDHCNSTDRSDWLRAARRPKPPSLKEQALAELDLLKGDANAHGLGFDAPAIRRALESLPD